MNRLSFNWILNKMLEKCIHHQHFKSKFNSLLYTYNHSWYKLYKREKKYPKQVDTSHLYEVYIIKCNCIKYFSYLIVKGIVPRSNDAFVKYKIIYRMKDGGAYSYRTNPGSTAIIGEHHNNQPVLTNLLDFCQDKTS